MLVIAFWVLVVAALGGAGMATLNINKPALRLAHGALGAVGLLIFLVGALMSGTGLIWTAFALVAIGFSAGALLFGVVYRQQRPPRAIIVGHALLNTAGTLLLGLALLL